MVAVTVYPFCHRRAAHSSTTCMFMVKCLIHAIKGVRYRVGKRPEVIVAKYQTTDGQTRDNLLLVSGWWGIARHFHYIGEIAGALAWTLPGRLAAFAPYLYVLYLTALLGHRS